MTQYPNNPSRRVVSVDHRDGDASVGVRPSGLCSSWRRCLRSASAQYFGRNKVQYRTFDFQILKTEHFDLYYYPEEAEAAAIVVAHGRAVVRAASRGSSSTSCAAARPSSSTRRRRISGRRTSIEGLIGEGTGGVTEALKRRIVLPMSRLARRHRPRARARARARVPVRHHGRRPAGGDGRGAGHSRVPAVVRRRAWPSTSRSGRWTRRRRCGCATPRCARSCRSIRDLDDPKYFPYRWGHAFWAYIGAKYGDRAVASLIRSAANPRFDLPGLARQLGTDPDKLDQPTGTTPSWRARRERRRRPSVARRATPRLLDQPRDGQRALQRRSARQPGRQAGGVLLRARPVLDRPLPGRRRDGQDRCASCRARRPIRTSTASSSSNSAGAWSPDGRALALTAVRTASP